MYIFKDRNTRGTYVKHTFYPCLYRQKPCTALPDRLDTYLITLITSEQINTSHIFSIVAYQHVDYSQEVLDQKARRRYRSNQ